jgi:[pyruvate, water dikinase]-phosphate phosphotransferase / [pyruvate, water dikinase] kinase
VLWSRVDLTAPAIHTLWIVDPQSSSPCGQNRQGGGQFLLPASSLALSTGLSQDSAVRIDLHLVSDSTGETIETIAKAALAQFDDVAVRRHFWPMVRSVGHLERILPELKAFPGLVLYTLVNPDLRLRFEQICREQGLTAISALDPVVDALSLALGQVAKGRPGGQHSLDAAYFARVEAIHFTMAHDDGLLHEEWEDADIVLAGVSRSSKTPTSIYLANRGYRTANIPIVPASPPPSSLFGLKNPLVVGLTTSADRLVAVRRNRLTAMGDVGSTDYAEEDAVRDELAYARRMFADQGWPVIDVTRRSIEETAAAIIRLVEERREQLSL